MPTVTEWTLAVISNVVHIGSIIAILYALRRFYKHRHCQALQKRSPLLDRSIEPMRKDEEIWHPHITSVTSIICYIFAIHGMAIMWIARSWIIYFNCQYGLEVQRGKWSVHLNDRYSNGLWFVKHRKDYGSNRVIYIIAISSYIIQASLQTFLLFKYPDIRIIYDQTSMMIELIISVIIWYKIPSFNDIFGIKTEMQWMLRVAGIILFLWIGWIAVKFTILGDNVWVFMIVRFILGIMISFMALILNGFIFYHTDYKHLISTTLRAPNSLVDVSTGEKRSLSQVLENVQLIEGLFAHLADEFSVELLLALIEFKQFHDLMANDDQFMAAIQHIVSDNFGDPRISECILFKISLTDKLPKSKIVHENHRDDEDNDPIKRYLGIACDLYNKYILVGAEFEVNLSHQHRQTITNFIQEYNDLSSANVLSEREQFELFVLFNDASDELHYLLHSSHDRYVISNNHALSSFDA